MKELVGFSVLKHSKHNKQVACTDKWHYHFSDGTKQLDPRMGGSSFILGYNNSAVMKGIEEEMLQVARCQSNDGYYTDYTNLAGEIVTQNVWDYYSWALSGTSAVEAAISMSDEYWKARKKSKPYIVSFSFTWHGTSYITKAMGAPFLLQHSSDRVINIDHPRWVKVEDRHDAEKVALKSLLDQIRKHDVGCVVFDSATILNQLSLFSEEWWRTIRDICNEYDILMITDDVASCWGKGGSYHPYQTFGYGVQPDISALGKSLAAGYAPIGAAVCTSKVGDVIKDSWNYNHTQHPYMLGIYAMINTYNYIERNKLLDNNITQSLNKVAEYFIDTGLATSYRSFGLLLSLDITKDAPYTGLSSSFNNHTINIVAPLIADDQYFAELKDYINECFLQPTNS